MTKLMKKLLAKICDWIINHYCYDEWLEIQKDGLTDEDINANLDRERERQQDMMRDCFNQGYEKCMRENQL